MRAGPRPLSAQIGMAASYWPPVTPDDHFPHREMPPELEKMLLGIRLYKTHQSKPEVMALDTVWREGSASLKAIPGYAPGAGQASVLLIPSLINKAHILDLMEGRSLMRFFAARGMTPYLLDWGMITDDPAQQDMDSVITRRLAPAIAALAEREGRPVHALGYCMGGTLLLGAAAQPFVQQSLASLVMLAAPWDFHAGSQALLNRVRFWAPSAAPLVAEKGCLPVDWIQAVFASLDPFLAAQKFAKFADMDQASEEAFLFVAVEDWLNDGVDLPAAVAQHCIREWFFENRPGLGVWEVAGAPVKPEDITIPALIVASRRDRLVEFDTAAILQQKLKRASLLSPDCGHIGMIAGRRSVELAWGPIAAWIAAQH